MFDVFDIQEEEDGMKRDASLDLTFAPILIGRTF